MTRHALAALAVASIFAKGGVAARFWPRRCHDVPFTARPPSAFGARCIAIPRGGSAGGDDEDDFWQEEIRRTKAFYTAPQSSRAAEILVTGGRAETENAGEEEAYEVEDVRTEDERVFGSAHAAGHVDEEEGVESMPQIEEAEEEGESTPVEGDGGAIDDQQGMETETDIGGQDLDGVEMAEAMQEDAGSVNNDEQERSDVTSIPNDAVVDEVQHVAAGDEDVSADEVAPEGATEGATATEAVDSSAEDSSAEDADSIVDQELVADADDATEEGVDTEEKATRIGIESTPESLEMSVQLADRSEAIVSKEEPHSEDAMEEWYPVPLLADRNVATAAASNKLVEEGLRRLERRDGDHPSVPYVITRAMKRVLVEELGYDPLEVDAMRPDVAVVIVGEGLARPEMESLPPRFFRGIEPAGAMNNVMEDASVKGSASSFMRSVRTKLTALFGGRDPQSTMIVAVSLGLALRFLSGHAHGSEKSREGSAQSMEVPLSIEVPASSISEPSDLEDEDDGHDVAPSSTPSPALQPDDLDKTWLDKIISWVIHPFGA